MGGNGSVTMVMGTGKFWALACVYMHRHPTLKKSIGHISVSQFSVGVRLSHRIDLLAKQAILVRNLTAQCLW